MANLAEALIEAQSIRNTADVARLIMECQELREKNAALQGLSDQVHEYIRRELEGCITADVDTFATAMVAIRIVQGGKLIRERDRYRLALERYADTDNWGRVKGAVDTYTAWFGCWPDDPGKPAREALEVQHG